MPTSPPLLELSCPNNNINFILLWESFHPPFIANEDKGPSYSSIIGFHESMFQIDKDHFVGMPVTNHTFLKLYIYKHTLFISNHFNTINRFQNNYTNTHFRSISIKLCNVLLLQHNNTVDMPTNFFQLHSPFNSHV